MTDQTTHHYDDGTHRFDYTLLLKPRQKHRYIRIRNGQVIVSAPRRSSQRSIEALLADKADWIVQHLHESQHNTPGDLTRPGAQIYWRGERYDVHIASGHPPRVTITEDRATFYLAGPSDHAVLLRLLQAHYRQHASEVLLPRVARWAATMGLFPERISFRRARTRWGSCSSRNTLSLNTYLLMLPDHLIDYVVIHELAHIRYKNHGPDFWACVARYLPDWKHHRQELKKFIPFLF